jgi:hypothetical protein
MNPKHCERGTYNFSVDVEHPLYWCAACGAVSGEPLKWLIPDNEKARQKRARDVYSYTVIQGNHVQHVRRRRKKET